jgi:hypothetical protein
MRLIKRQHRPGAHPRCGARTRSGHRCRRYVAVDPWTKKLRKRCRLHGGLSTGPKFPDAKERSLAAANAGLARWRERMRAAKAAGLITKFPNGRKPGPTKWQREEAELAAVEERERRHLAFKDARRPPPWPARRGGSSFVKTLEGLERTLIARLSDRDPPPRDLIEEVLGDILQGEEMFGRAAGKEERLAWVSWAYEDWRTKEAVKRVLTQLAQERAARAAQASAPATDINETIRAPDQSPSGESEAQVGASAHEDDAVKSTLSPELAARYEAIDARAKRRRLRWLELEAKRARERKRGAPMTLFGVHFRYIESIGDESGPKLPCLAQAEPRGSSPKP